MRADDTDNSSEATHTVARGHRTSFWVRTLQAARDRGDWTRVPRFYTQATAAQITSDIVNARHRAPNTVRVRGILTGEQWEARWGHAPDGPNGDYVVWIRLVPNADAPLGG